MQRKIAIGILAACGIAIWLARPGVRLETGSGGKAAQPTSTAGVLVFDLRDGATSEEIAAFELRYGLKLEYSHEVAGDEALLRAQVDDLAAVADRVRDDPLVELVEPAFRLEAHGFPDDPRYAEQWNMTLIGALTGWRAGGGRGVTVAVLDTGISSVEDLQSTRIGDGLSVIPGVPEAIDDHGHGTHVAGSVAQSTHNGVGVTGVAPGATVLPFKVLSGQGSGASDRIAAAIDEAADRGVDVINMSLGGPHSDVLAKAAADAARRGVLVVASAGNTGRRGLGCPGGVREVIGVAATGPTDERAPYSTYGDGVEIAAPGGDLGRPGGGILQDTIDGEGGQGHAYKSFQGTSMASPHIAGALAVLMGMGLAPRAAVHALYDTARDLGPPGFDEQFGHGRVDVAAAVRHTALFRGGMRSAIGGGFALALALLIGVRRRLVAIAVPVAALAAGGLFFLPLLPISPGWATHLLSLDAMRWSGPILGFGWVHNPVWASALPAVALTFLLGLFRPFAPWVAGVAAGFGAIAICGAANQSLAAFDGATVNSIWLLANGAICLGAAAAVMIARRVEYST